VQRGGHAVRWRPRRLRHLVPTRFVRDTRWVPAPASRPGGPGPRGFPRCPALALWGPRSPAPPAAPLLNFGEATAGAPGRGGPVRAARAAPAPVAKTGRVTAHSPAPALRYALTQPWPPSGEGQEPCHHTRPGAVEGGHAAGWEYGGTAAATPRRVPVPGWPPRAPSWSVAVVPAPRFPGPGQALRGPNMVHEHGPPCPRGCSGREGPELGSTLQVGAGQEPR